MKIYKSVFKETKKMEIGKIYKVTVMKVPIYQSKLTPSFKESERFIILSDKNVGTMSSSIKGLKPKGVKNIIRTTFNIENNIISNQKAKYEIISEPKEI